MTNTVTHTIDSRHKLILGAIGIVFGDIGTSPLYAFKECLKSFSLETVSESSILGLCSLIFWAVFLIVSIKYVFFVMRADNNGEGGILSLMSLANLVAPAKVKSWIIILGLFGAATFYGDSIITPAISVLSAVEGLELVSASFKPYVIAISCAILFILFKIQKQGTSSIGKMFGPVMILWFSTLGLLGLYHILSHPVVLVALNPFYAVSFLYAQPGIAGIIMGSVFLAVTGGEALYADMGHFGKAPISKAWFWFVFQSLILNYFGQGALILQNPKVIESPFYSMVPNWGLIPLVILATLATVIASQAVISGAFSMTKQAVQLGYIPRLNILHTSDNEIGQIYIPFINWLIFGAVVCLLFIFKNSDSLASAYGIAVVTTMLITTLLISIVAKYQWQWSNKKLLCFMFGFFTIDLIFLSTNFLKIAHGGWIPLVFAGFIFFLMTTWKKGRSLVRNSLKEHSFDLDFILPNIINDKFTNHTIGTAVFLSSIAGKTPVSFMHNLKHNHVLHKHVIFFTMTTQDIPYVADKDKFSVSEICSGCYQICVKIGFKEQPNVPAFLKMIEKQNKIENWTYNEMETSYFLSRETIIATPGSGMPIWREKLFGWMSKNATNAGHYFQIPHNRVVELGAQVCI